jgi:hypothetical protein
VVAKAELVVVTRRQGPPACARPRPPGLRGGDGHRSTENQLNRSTMRL